MSAFAGVCKQKHLTDKLKLHSKIMLNYFLNIGNILFNIKLIINIININSNIDTIKIEQTNNFTYRYSVQCTVYVCICVPASESWLE